MLQPIQPTLADLMRDLAFDQAERDYERRGGDIDAPNEEGLGVARTTAYIESDQWTLLSTNNRWTAHLIFKHGFGESIAVQIASVIQPDPKQQCSCGFVAGGIGGGI